MARFLVTVTDDSNADFKIYVVAPSARAAEECAFDAYTLSDIVITNARATEVESIPADKPVLNGVS